MAGNQRIGVYTCKKPCSAKHLCLCKQTAINATSFVCVCVCVQNRTESAEEFVSLHTVYVILFLRCVVGSTCIGKVIITVLFNERSKLFYLWSECIDWCVQEEGGMDRCLLVRNYLLLELSVLVKWLSLHSESLSSKQLLQVEQFQFSALCVCCVHARVAGTELCMHWELSCACWSTV